MGTWTNADGLYVKFGPTEVTVTTGGEFETDGPFRITEVEISDLTTITATAGATILADNVMIPKGARIESVQIINKTAATSGGSAVLNVGLVKQDRTTEIDFDGLVAAQAITSHDAAGEQTTLTPGSTAAGALIGTTLADPGLFVADYDTAAYTAGALYIRVRWYVPY
jgi:hypothetical protein